LNIEQTIVKQTPNKTIDNIIIMDLTKILDSSWKIIKKAIIIDAIIAILSIILWILWRKNAAISLADTVFILGSIVMGCGAYFIIGAKIGSVDYLYWQSRPASQISYQDRLGQEMDYIDKSYYQATIFFVAGLVAIGGGVIIYQIAG
jgi:hypothetical protein